MTELKDHELKVVPPAMLLTAAGLVFLAAIVYRAFYFMELSGPVCYELEAASRLRAGQIPFYDFYFDQSLLNAYLRLPTVILARLFGDLAHSDEILVVTPYWASALASYITTTIVALLSFSLCCYITLKSSLSEKNLRLLAAVLVGIGLANFATGFVFGCAQHIFCLFFTPYLFLRASIWSGGKPALPLHIICGLLAGLGAGLNPLFLSLPLFIEVAELVAAGFQKRKPAVEFFVLLVTFVLSWTWIFLLNSDSISQLDDWIVPLKFASLHLDQIAFYGYGSSPDRRSVIYLCTAVMVACFGLVGRAQVLRPLATAMMCGFFIFLATMTGVSSELLILIWFISLTLPVLAVLFIDGSLVTNFARRYPHLSYRERRVNRVKTFLFALFCLSSLAVVTFCETMERRENIAVAVGPQATDPYLLDLEAAVLKYSKPQEKILILNGRLLPTFPLYAQVNRPICGYYLSSEPLSTVASIEGHALTDQSLGKPFAWLARVKAKLYTRIGAEIQIQKPALILVEGGQTWDNLKEMGILPFILKDYKSEGEARYHSSCSGTREFADWNYRYNILKRIK